MDSDRANDASRSRALPESLFPYIDTCAGCSGYGRDREGSRCQECGGNGVGPQSGIHPRVRHLDDQAQSVQISASRTVWPHLDTMTDYDWRLVHRRGDST